MVKKLSEQIIFSYLIERSRASVPQLAGHFALPPSTVVDIINRLRRKGLVSAGPLDSGHRGRPTVTYRLKLPGPIAVCQLEGTRVTAAILNEDLSIGVFESTNVKQLETVKKAGFLVQKILKRLFSESKFSARKIQGLMLSINAVNTGAMTLCSSVLPWVDKTVEEVFSGMMGMPVKMVSSILSQAECRKYPGSVPSPAVLFNVADGVSAHAVINGQVYLGGSGLAGELGHIVADPQGPLCGCGRRGCLEAYCSGPAIYKQLLCGLKSGVSSVIQEKSLRNFSPREAMEYVWQSWKKGDGYVRACLEEVFERLGWGLGLTINLVDPCVVVVKGYVLKGKPDWIEEIRRRSQRWMLWVSSRKIEFEESRATVKDELQAIGARFYSPVMGKR